MRLERASQSQNLQDPIRCRMRCISTAVTRESIYRPRHPRPDPIFVVQMIYKYFPLVWQIARYERSKPAL